MTEKTETQAVELENAHAMSPTKEATYMEYPESDRKKVLRKMDVRIPPILMMLYLLSYMDRANIGNAKIEGMTKDLHLSGKEYNVVLSVFFATYIVFEIPSNYVMERWFTFRPSIWLGIITAGWGVMMTLVSL